MELKMEEMTNLVILSEQEKNEIAENFEREQQEIEKFFKEIIPNLMPSPQGAYKENK